MKKLFTAENYGWNIDGLKLCIKDNKLKSKILFSNPNGAIVHVTSYNESVILGAESEWCISQHNVSWEQYVVKPKGIQLFFYCFNEKAESDYSLYGATFQIKDDEVKTMCCFTRENNPIGKARGFDTDEEALMGTVVGPVFGDIFSQLAEAIFSIGMPKKEKVIAKTDTNNMCSTKKEKVAKKTYSSMFDTCTLFEPYYSYFFDEYFDNYDELF